MASNHFRFKHFTICQERPVFKVGTDGVILGAAADINGVSGILDIGAGTGLISIMLAQRSNARITAIEPDEESYMQLQDNVSTCRWKERIKTVNSTLQDYQAHEPFDLIVSNPPYFISSLKSPDALRTATRHNDSLPHQDLLKGVVRLLAEEGKFQVIMPVIEGNKLIEEARPLNIFCNSVINIRPVPTSGVKRVLLSFSRTKLDFKQSFLVIEDGRRHNYTSDYINLTKDFYLKF